MHLVYHISYLHYITASQTMTVVPSMLLSAGFSGWSIAAPRIVDPETKDDSACSGASKRILHPRDCKYE